MKHGVITGGLKIKIDSDGISVITITGDREESFERCKYYLERQTLQPDQWIVADDSRKLNPVHMQCDYVNNKYPGDSKKSFLNNIISALELVECEIIVFFEDDDWYSPEYLQITKQRLQNIDAVGEIRAVYYNVQHRLWRKQQNDHRASLAQTAIRSRLLPKLKKYCRNRNTTFVDSRIWHHIKTNKIPYRFFETQYSIGIKGMPGRKGIGIGHRPPKSYRYDRDFKHLENLIGKEDMEYYKQLCKKMGWR